MVLYHTFYVQVFGYYVSIGIYEVTGGLMMKIGMLVADLPQLRREVFPSF